MVALKWYRLWCILVYLDSALYDTLCTNMKWAWEPIWYVVQFILELTLCPILCPTRHDAMMALISTNIYDMLCCKDVDMSPIWHTLVYVILVYFGVNVVSNTCPKQHDAEMAPISSNLYCFLCSTCLTWTQK